MLGFFLEGRWGERGVAKTANALVIPDARQPVKQKLRETSYDLKA